MDLLIFLGCCVLIVAVASTGKPKSREHYTLYRNRLVRISEVPPYQVAQLN